MQQINAQIEQQKIQQQEAQNNQTNETEVIEAPAVDPKINEQFAEPTQQQPDTSEPRFYDKLKELGQLQQKYKEVRIVQSQSVWATGNQKQKKPKKIDKSQSKDGQNHLDKKMPKKSKKMKAGMAQVQDLSQLLNNDANTMSAIPDITNIQRQSTSSISNFEIPPSFASLQ